MRIAKAAELSAQTATIFAQEVVHLPNPLVYLHLADSLDRVHRRTYLSAVVARAVTCPPVKLVRYPSGTLVDGDKSYLVSADGMFVREQVAPGINDLVENSRWMLSQASNAIEISVPCLLVARYGEITWGHWIAEILIKAAIVEQLYPGRVHYAVPASITEVTPERSYSTAVLESLSAYGIAANRLVRLEASRVYKFRELYDVADIFSDGMHPAAIRFLQSGVELTSSGRGTSKVATIRRRPETRAVFNANRAEGILKSQGFKLIDPAALPFVEQISLFKNAETIVGSLGSNLTSLLFAPRNIGIVTLGPASWADAYFTQIAQRLDARQADVRGPSTQFESADVSKSSHLADPQRLGEALAAVSSSNRPGEVMLDGEMLPYRLGPPILMIRFCRGGNSENFVREGWSDPEDTHRWSLGRSCSLLLSQGALPHKSLWVVIEGIGHVCNPFMTIRPLRMLFNDEPLGAFDISGRVRLQCKLDGHLGKSHGGGRLTFEHPVCPSPQMMGGGDDARPLGFGFETVSFHEVAP